MELNHTLTEVDLILATGALGEGFLGKSKEKLLAEDYKALYQALESLKESHRHLRDTHERLTNDHLTLQDENLANHTKALYCKRR